MKRTSGPRKLKAKPAPARQRGGKVAAGAVAVGVVAGAGARPGRPSRPGGIPRAKVKLSSSGRPVALPRPRARVTPNFSSSVRRAPRISQGARARRPAQASRPAARMVSVVTAPPARRPPRPARQTSTRARAGHPSPAKATPAPRRRLARKGAPPKGGKFVSRAQHRWAYASHQPWAHRAAVRGRYRRLPERKARATARTAL